LAPAPNPAGNVVSRGSIASLQVGFARVMTR
jgi:hypothetical protein